MNCDGHRVNSDDDAIDSSGYELDSAGARVDQNNDGDNVINSDDRLENRTQVRITGAKQFKITGAKQFKPENTTPVKATAAERYHYNEEAVTITLSES